MGIVAAVYVNQLFDFIPTAEILKFGGGLRPDFPALENFAYRNYGVCLEMILVGIEFVFKLTESRQLYLVRHFATFMVFFFGVILFYLTIFQVFNNRTLAIVGCVLLIVSPRIFAHSFYDLKDIAPMTLFVASIYTLLRSLETQRATMIMLHALSIALFIDTRIAGIFLPFVSLLFMGLGFIKNYLQNEPQVRLTRNCFLFIGCLLLFVYLFWPYLWADPIGRFLAAIVNMSDFAEQYDYNAQMIYMGEFISVRDVPWHYLPVWILITTPVLYSLLFVIGTFTILYHLVRAPRLLLTDSTERFGALMLLLFYGPIIGVIATSSMLLDGWRHLYFCYPAFLLVGLTGLEYIRKLPQQKTAPIIGRLKRQVGIALIVVAVGGTATNMVINHPYQNVYFNVLAGTDIEKNWELDYWGVSFRQGLEYVLAYDDSTQINVSVSSEPGQTNLKILKKKDRNRVNIVEENQAKYHLSNYRYQKEYKRLQQSQPPLDNEIFHIEVISMFDKYRIMGVYRVDQ
jgi:hypothetical protein